MELYNVTMKKKEEIHAGEKTEQSNRFFFLIYNKTVALLSMKQLHYCRWSNLNGTSSWKSMYYVERFHITIFQKVYGIR